METNLQEDSRHAVTLVTIVAVAASIALMSYLYYWRTRPHRDAAALQSVSDSLEELNRRLQALQGGS